MILLDTHAWVRWLHPEISRKLPDRLRTWLEAADAPLAVSVISALEVAQLASRAELVIGAMGRGDVSVDMAQAMLAALNIQARITESSDLAARIEKLEEVLLNGRAIP